MSDPTFKICTTHDYPPIPLRNFDWSAYRDGSEEGITGQGATESEAVFNFAQEVVESEPEWSPSEWQSFHEEILPYIRRTEKEAREFRTENAKLKEKLAKAEARVAELEAALLNIEEVAPPDYGGCLASAALAGKETE